MQPTLLPCLTGKGGWVVDQAYCGGALGASAGLGGA